VKIGSTVRYRLWESNDFQVGTITRFWRGVSGKEYVDISRNRFREVTVFPLHKFLDKNLVREV
jgi:hypothetical protein